VDLTPEERRAIYEEERQKEQSRPVTIQRTGKNIKVWFIVGWGLILLGVSIFGKGTEDGKTFGAAFMVIGFLVLIGAKLARWWNHG
jgi:hypothetical protein